MLQPLKTSKIAINKSPSITRNDSQNKNFFDKRVTYAIFPKNN